MYTVRYTWQPY